MQPENESRRDKKSAHESYVLRASADDSDEQGGEAGKRPLLNEP